MYMEEGGRQMVIFFTQTYDLWTKQNADSLPSTLNFQISFPSHYTNEQGSHPVPPSYSFVFPAMHQVRAGNVYMVTVTVTKKQFGIWEKQKT